MKNETSTQASAERSMAAQQQQPSHSRMEVEVHPWDEYLASLEPESLQVLVSVSVVLNQHDQCIYLSVCVLALCTLSISKSSPHTILMITKTFILLQTYIKVANVSDSLTVTPNVWQSVMGMQ